MRTGAAPDGSGPVRGARQAKVTLTMIFVWKTKKKKRKSSCGWWEMSANTVHVCKKKWSKSLTHFYDSSQPRHREKNDAFFFFFYTSMRVCMSAFVWIPLPFNCPRWGLARFRHVLSASIHESFTRCTVSFHRSSVVEEEEEERSPRATSCTSANHVLIRLRWREPGKSDFFFFFLNTWVDEKEIKCLKAYACQSLLLLLVF